MCGNGWAAVTKFGGEKSWKGGGWTVGEGIEEGTKIAWDAPSLGPCRICFVHHSCWDCE